MYLLALAVSIVGSLTVARRFAEPSCPGCSAKEWSGDFARLECRNCGWSNAAMVMPSTTDAAFQYEIALHGSD